MYACAIRHTARRYGNDAIHQPMGHTLRQAHINCMLYGACSSCRLSQLYRRASLWRIARRAAVSTSAVKRFTGCENCDYGVMAMHPPSCAITHAVLLVLTCCLAEWRSCCPWCILCTTPAEQRLWCCIRDAAMGGQWGICRMCLMNVRGIRVLCCNHLQALQCLL